MTEKPMTIVLKLGSSSILQESAPHLPRLSVMAAIVETCTNLRQMGHRVVLVSSGAVAMGRHRLDLLSQAPAAPLSEKQKLTMKQSLSAIGQGRLIALWDQLFSTVQQPIAQILLTRHDIADRSRYYNATSTLGYLLQSGVIPIINENDTIAVGEIRNIEKFGDNDSLSAIAAGLCQADYLFLLTDVDGVYEDNPRKNPAARRLSYVNDLDVARRMIQTSTPGSGMGTGGMETKLIAAEYAIAAGCATVIAASNHPERVESIVRRLGRTPPAAQGAEPVEFELSNEPIPCTVFRPQAKALSTKRWWVLHALKPYGTVHIDTGAFHAVSRKGNGGRLLAAGVLRVDGAFHAGQAVTVRATAPDGALVEGRGLANYNSHDMDCIKGLKSRDIEAALGYIESEHVVDGIIFKGDSDDV